MILVRDIFRIKVGRMKDAVASVKDARSLFDSLGSDVQMRALTDLAGPEYYTLTLEMTLPDLNAWEKMLQAGFSNPGWQQWYAGFLPLLEPGGRREIHTVVV